MKTKHGTSDDELRDRLTGNAFLHNPSVSVNECTGITPRVPKSGSEAQAYTDIYDVPVSAGNGAVRYKKTERDPHDKMRKA